MRVQDVMMVVEVGGGPLGIVTVADLLELIGRGVERPAAESTRRTLNHRVPHRPRSRSAGAW